MKYIAGYELLYSVSKDGNIYSHRNKSYLKQSISYSKKKLPTRCEVTLCKNGVEKKFSVHRLVAETFIKNPSYLPIVDHIDRNPLNNKKENLRWCTKSQNQQNKAWSGRVKTSIYKGISWDKHFMKWASYINISPNKNKRLGSYDSEEEAAAVYNNAAKKYFGKFAFLNEIKTGT